ncbi:MAG: carbamoyltransferase C-terminal domain-containing protein [Pseudomonadota bacterium]
MSNIVIGLNAYHGDSSACILVDGEIVAAAEEERFLRTKHWAGFPARSIEYCLSEANAKLSEVDCIAVNSDSSAHRSKKVLYVATQRPSPKLVLDRLRNRKKRDSFDEALQTRFPDDRFAGQIVPVEHHLAHLASAYHCSPFEDSTVVSVDGFGDFCSTAWGIGREGNLAIEGRVFFPHSLGIFYQAMTQYLGFPNYGDEYKVMGLAPYGQPTYLDAMREVVRTGSNGTFRLALNYFVHHVTDVRYAWNEGSPSVGRLFSPALETLLGPARDPSQPLEDKHRDLARSIQARYEEVFFNLLNSLHKKHGLTRISVAGGCGMNSVANGKIARETPFEVSYIQSAAGDAGGAIGAALVAQRQVFGPSRAGKMPHAYLGPSYDSNAICAVIDRNQSDLEDAGCTVSEPESFDALCKRVVAALTDGGVIGWFQGRMEWGPRALGNRSILGDPRRSDMKDILNLKIKRRESFRPFAPSIMRAHVAEWFEEEADVPFMMKVFQILPAKREEIPAVTHVDGSGRLQTVDQRTNPRYHRLIEHFYEKTSVPMLLNTSFNENEPVVCTPQEAMDCFLRTQMDVLVLNDVLIERSAG